MRARQRPALSDRAHDLRRAAADRHAYAHQGRAEHLGIIACAEPRPPLMPVSDDLARRIARVVDAAGLADRV